VLLVGLSIPHDKAAHFGGSWALNTTVYTVCNLTGDGLEVPCLLLSSCLTIGAGLAWEEMGDRSEGDILADFIGVGLSSVMISLSW